MSDPVLELLQKHNLVYKLSGRDYVVKCLNPEHDDSNPSFRIDRVTGVAHCFSCGFKTNVFKHFGIFTNPVPIKIAKLKQKLRELSANINGVDLPPGIVPYTKPFRGISPKTLKHFEAFYTHQVEALQDRIAFPIKDVTGKIQVFVARHTLSSGNPRYINYPAGVQLPLFPAKVPETTSIILVEGIFDLLNLYDKGLHPVVCTFGTNTLQNDTKLKMLPYKAQGITKVYIMFDGDDAGQKAAKVLEPLIQDSGFLTEIIDLPDGTDPGELNQEMVTSIQNYIGYKDETRSLN
jgi:DNA primase